MIQSKFYIDKYGNKGYDKKIYQKLMLNKLKVNGRSYPYLYPIGDLAQGSFHKASMSAPTKEAF
jgi:hypothetical protein